MIFLDDTNYLKKLWQLRAKNGLVEEKYFPSWKNIFL